MKLFLIGFLAVGSAIAQESDLPKETKQEVTQQFGYVSAGVGPLPIPLPIFGVGYRTQKNHHGADLSLQVSTIFAITQVKTSFLYHHYFKPNLNSQFYAGGGIGPSVVFGHYDDNGFLISPEFVFGKQYRNESDDLRFFQAQVSFPTVWLYDFGGRHQHHHHWKPRAELYKFPLLTLSYGIAF